MSEPEQVIASLNKETAVLQNAIGRHVANLSLFGNKESEAILSDLHRQLGGVSRLKKQLEAEIEYGDLTVELVDVESHLATLPTGTQEWRKFDHKRHKINNRIEACLRAMEQDS